MGSADGGRWERRPGAAALVRLGAVAVPVAVGFGVAVVFALVVERPRDGLALVAWWAASLAASSIAFAVVWRQAQRVLPLATLLKWQLAFPDRAPSRFRVALRAGSTRTLARRVEELHANHADLNTEHALETVVALAAALNAHDRLTRGRSERVRALSELTAAQLKVDAAGREKLRWASLLHDCGKLAVDPGILSKPGPLDDAEWLAMRRHPEEGAHLAEPLREWLGDWAHSIEQHHEKWDGSGYPSGLSGKDIALGARIVAVADAYDVMTSHRSYRSPQTPASAKAELARSAGDHFDPDIVRAFLQVSTGYLAWLLFPFAWMAQLPLALSGASSAAARGIRVATQSASAAAAGTVAVVTGVALGLAPVADSPSRPNVTRPTSTPLIAAPAAATPITTPVAAPVDAPRAAARARSSSAVVPAARPEAPVGQPPATSPRRAKPAPQPRAAESTHLIRLAACVDPVRIVIELIPGVNIVPTKAC